jgi:DNA-directed RNA polymerase specialized sigma24 family protein
VRRVSAGGWANRERVSAELANEATRIRLKRLAMRHTGSEADAEGLVCRAIAKVIEARGTGWDPTERGFDRHVGSLINSLAADAKRNGRAHREVLEDNIGEGPTDSAPSPESALERKRGGSLQERALRLYELLGARDEVACRVMEATQAGCETVEEMAALIGCSVQAVVAARRRLISHARAVVTEHEAVESQRRQQLRGRGAGAERKGARR